MKRPITLSGHSNYVMDNLFISEDRIVVTCSLDKTLRTWDTRILVHKDTKTGHSKGVEHLAYAKPYRVILSASCEKEFFAWSTLSAKPIHKFEGHASSIVNIHAFDDSPEVISVDTHGTVLVWDM